MKGLIVDEPWIGLILQGWKTWEMRKTPCRQRGLIALIRRGENVVSGIGEIGGSGAPLDTMEAFGAAERFHRIPSERQARAFSDGFRMPWILRNVEPLPMPVRYRHPPGAVIWVGLEPDVVAKVIAQRSPDLRRA
jgi:hypothetical protein